MTNDKLQSDNIERCHEFVRRTNVGHERSEEPSPASATITSYSVNLSSAKIRSPDFELLNNQVCSPIAKSDTERGYRLLEYANALLGTTHSRVLLLIVLYINGIFYLLIV